MIVTGPTRSIKARINHARQTQGQAVRRCPWDNQQITAEGKMLAARGAETSEYGLESKVVENAKPSSCGTNWWWLTDWTLWCGGEQEEKVAVVDVASPSGINIEMKNLETSEVPRAERTAGKDVEGEDNSRMNVWDVHTYVWTLHASCGTRQPLLAEHVWFNVQVDHSSWQIHVSDTQTRISSRLLQFSSAFLPVQLPEHVWIRCVHSSRRWRTPDVVNQQGTGQG